MPALLLVDLQNDFFAKGALAVKQAEEILPVANTLSQRFSNVIASQDWHPKNHQSFASFHQLNPGEVVDLHGIQQVLWPEHCVQNTLGAAFHEKLDCKPIQHVIQKGTNPKLDSYSAFFENDKKTPTGLVEYLKKQGVQTLYILGLATDYCVKYTALDAKALGFEVCLVVDGCQAVNLEPQAGLQALKDMQQVGIKLVNSQAIKPAVIV